MERIGLDLHKREGQLAIKADDGTLADRRIATSRERFTMWRDGVPYDAGQLRPRMATGADV